MPAETRERNIIDELCDYIAGAGSREIPEDVATKAKHHILDTVASMVSGAHLEPGQMAIKYARAMGGAAEASVIGTDLETTVINAALANGMMAHADETDDSHLLARAHIGCSVVPAALAMAEKEGSDGAALLRSVILGYDIGARFNLALNLGGIQTYALCTHSHGPGFGAAAAAASLAGLDPRQVRFLLAYSAQQASGLKTYMRDLEHIEKAFIFGGMPARNGVTAATMVAAGFSGIPDDVDGRDGYLQAFSDDPRPEALVEDLGERFEVMRTNIKKWSVGSPIQAALDSIEVLMNEHGLRADDVTAITARLPDDRAYVVDNREMPDICLQHLIAVTLIDGGLSFAACHDEVRMQDPEILALRGKVTLVPEAFLTEARPERQAIIEATLSDGRELSHRTVAVRGTPENPMETGEVEEKARGLMAPVLGDRRTEDLIAAIADIEGLGDARDLRPVLTGG
ncbi:MAG: MmgE/PrpD family protein [Alphaproteobacteria bacterium]|nr:MmgE/PrpD family protein [Alphaproteobacteria bacterium]